MYLTYNEYKQMGGKLDESEFNGFEWEAENIVDWYTFNRLRIGDEYPEAVKKCVYRLINIAEQKRQALSLGVDQSGNTTASIASQSNDGVSISFNTMSASQAFDVMDKEIPKIINQYLDGVRNNLGRRLLYRGIYPGE